MNKECIGCKAAKECSTAVEYGSVMCMIKMLNSGQTKYELQNQQGTKYCPHCGKPLN